MCSFRACFTTLAASISWRARGGAIGGNGVLPVRNTQAPQRDAHCADPVRPAHFRHQVSDAAADRAVFFHRDRGRTNFWIAASSALGITKDE